MDTHQDSWASVAGGLIAAFALGAAAIHLWAKSKYGWAALCALVCLAALPVGVYLAYWYEGDLDRQDQQAKETVIAAGLRFVEVDDGDIRVAKAMPGGKTCEATFRMAGWDRSKLPFPEGSGRNPSKGCGIDDLEDNDGGLPHQDYLTDQEKALDKIFAPRSKK